MRSEDLFGRALGEVECGAMESCGAVVPECRKLCKAQFPGVDPARRALATVSNTRNRSPCSHRSIPGSSDARRSSPAPANTVVLDASAFRVTEFDHAGEPVVGASPALWMIRSLRSPCSSQSFTTTGRCRRSGSSLGTRSRRPASDVSDRCGRLPRNRMHGYGIAGECIHRDHVDPTGASRSRLSRPSPRTTSIFAWVAVRKVNSL